MSLVRKYQADIEVFGLVDFKSTKAEAQGRPTEYATLNERQSTLIMSYMKNTAIIRQFKTRFIEKPF
jgi:phage regulator Rha-like protein